MREVVFILKFVFIYRHLYVFEAIESGRLPGDALDDLPCKYVDGSLVCEVRDSRAQSMFFVYLVEKNATRE